MRITQNQLITTLQAQPPKPFHLLKPLLALAITSSHLLTSNHLSSLLISSIAPHSFPLSVLIFSILPSPSAFAYTSLFHHASASHPSLALSLFRRFVASNLYPDEFTYPFLFRAASVLDNSSAVSMLHASAICHGLLDSTNVHARTSLMNSYAVLRMLDAAFKVFNEMTEKTVVTYNALLTRCARAGRHQHGLQLFCDVLVKTVPVNQDTVIAALASCTGLSAGRAVHAVAVRRFLGAGIASVSTALIHMYAKCGSLDAARTVFNGIGVYKDAPAWTAMVATLTMHAHGEEALALFEEMREKGRVLPDGVTFTCAIQACGHSGMTDKGVRLFDEMTNVYKIMPRMEHYGAMVDMLCRVGRWADAVAFVEAMPLASNREVWGTLLHACTDGERLELRTLCEERMEEIDGEEDEGVGFFVGVSNAYARSEMWDEVWKVRERMVKKGVKKEQGFSVVQVNGEVHRFLVGDVRHPLALQIYEVLDWIYVCCHD